MIASAEPRPAARRRARRSDYSWTPSVWRGWRQRHDPYRRRKSTRDAEIVLGFLSGASGSLLDAGCGYGWIAERIAAGGRLDWIGLDKSLDMARAAAQLKVGPVANGDLERIPFGDAAFDHVVCAGVLMHVRDPQAVLTEINRVLVSGGSLVSSVNSAWHPAAPAMRALALVRPGYTHRFTRPGRFERALRESGFSVEDRDSDGVVGVVAARVRSLLVPPARLHRALVKVDRAVLGRSPRFGYEYFVRAVKV